jgi:hypothetical protein
VVSRWRCCRSLAHAPVEGEAKTKALLQTERAIVLAA